MASEAKKCPHTLCSCMGADGQKFCSQSCEDNMGVTTLACDCLHTACAGHAV